jgi:hypothetical protein
VTRKPETPEKDRCQYSAAHYRLGIEATTVLDHPTLGHVKACERCAAFHARMSEPRNKRSEEQQNLS